MFCLRAVQRLLPLDSITAVDLTELERLEVSVVSCGETIVLRDQDAIDAVLMLRPSAFEGRRMRFARNAWVRHNLIGHPLMQICAWIGLPQLGLFFHDRTIPRPLPISR